MIEPEMAYATQEDNMVIQEEFLSYIVQRCLAKRRQELITLERDLSKLECIVPPFPRLSYDEAVELLHGGRVRNSSGGETISGGRPTRLRFR